MSPDEHVARPPLPNELSDALLFHPSPPARSLGLTPPPSFGMHVLAVNALAGPASAPAARYGWKATDPARDWRQHGLVTQVKDQGNCGSCWAFASTAVAESACAVATGKLHLMSEQDILSNSGAGSCNGGWWAFDYVIKAGVTRSALDPYLGRNRGPRGPFPVEYRGDSWGYVGDSEHVPGAAKIKQALCDYGPIAIGINATNAFQAYAGGVFREPGASADTNHAIDLIGWNDPGGYWVIKNSWTTSWGEKGFGRIAYGSNGIGFGAAWLAMRDS